MEAPELGRDMEVVQSRVAPAPEERLATIGLASLTDRDRLTDWPATVLPCCAAFG